MHAGLAQVLRIAFRKLGRHRYEATIQPDDAISIPLVRELGFRREGYDPCCLEVAGCCRDHERWAISRDEPPLG